MTTTTQSSEALLAQVDDLRLRHEHALKRAHELRELRNTAAGARVLGEVDEEELASANTSLTEAENVSASLGSALALVNERLKEAEERESQERRAELKGEAATARKAGSKLPAKVDGILVALRAALNEGDDLAASISGIQSELMRGLDAELDAITERYRLRYEELRRVAPPGQEPNETSLQMRLDDDRLAARERAAAEVAELAPSLDAGALEAVIDKHADLLPRLVDSETRAALSRGMEFVGSPVSAEPSRFGHMQSSHRVYASHEVKEADQRHAELMAALRRLGGPPAQKIGADELRYGGTA